MKTRSLILDLLIAGRDGALCSVTALLVLLLTACAGPQIGIGRTPTPSPAVAITRTPTPSPAPTSTLSPTPTATSQPSPRPALPTPTSIPTATPPAEAPAHVEALPMAIRPETLLLSAGDSACFYVGPLSPWRLGVRSSWSVDGLPAAATADARRPEGSDPARRLSADRCFLCSRRRAVSFRRYSRRSWYDLERPGHACDSSLRGIQTRRVYRINE